MYGHEGVTRALKHRLERRLPAALNYIRVTKGAGLRALPNPARILPHFVPDIDVDAYPTLAITELETPTGLTGAREMRQGATHDSYVYNYPFRIWFHVRGVDYGDTELQLKRYMTAIRMVILEDRVLVSTDEAHVVFDPETLSENFDSPGEDEARQVLGVGFIGVVLESTETINFSLADPRLELPTEIEGGVSVQDRVTDAPTGRPAPFEGGQQ